MWEGEVGDGSHVLVPQGKAGSVSAQELGPYLTGCIFLLSGCCRGMQHERVCIWARIRAAHPQQAPDSRGTRAVPSHEGIRVRVSACQAAGGSRCLVALAASMFTGLLYPSGHSRFLICIAGPTRSW